MAEPFQQITEREKFTSYQGFIIFIIAILQFTIILDFMVLSPVGVMVMPELHINARQFSEVVSAYALCAGVAGFIAAGFMDKFDRKKLLMFFYTGFIAGTTLCAFADTYEFLLGARIVTGVFGGVIGSISFAIIADLFRVEMRGRVMGFVQMAFAASQVLGLPIGLFLANYYGWHAPFLLIAAFSVLLGFAILVFMKPVNEHLRIASRQNPFRHLYKTTTNPQYLRAFLATTLMATGGYMLMPFGSNFAIHNLGLTVSNLPYLYAVTGIFSIAFGPMIGLLSDKIGKFVTFLGGSLISLVLVLVYTNLDVTPFWIIATLNVVLFVGISARMISASALMTSVPEPADRGAFMSVNSSIQQISGGLASMLAGMLVAQRANGYMENYPRLGYVVAGSMIIAAALLYFVDQHVKEKNARIAIQQSLEIPANL